MAERVARWAFLLVTLAGLAAVFLPALTVEARLGPRTTLSLYRAQADRAMAARFIAAYGKSRSRRLGGALVGKLMPKTSGTTHDVLDDTQSAMEDLDGITPDDAKLYGRIAAVAVWLLLAMHVLAFAAVMADAIAGVTKLLRAVVAAVATLVAAAIAAAAYGVLGEVVFEVNDEVGRDVIALGAGAYAMVATAAIAVLAIAMITIGGVRARRHDVLVQEPARR